MSDNGHNEDFTAVNSRPSIWHFVEPEKLGARTKAILHSIFRALNIFVPSLQRSLFQFRRVPRKGE
jgi:hypothetical protein